ncbi:hypothetical protein KW797_03280 [Candidatus Parcubacteria bacterium]|nr:hypothetical protein [Candidatus Parcubacteria bacterium]
MSSRTYLLGLDTAQQNLGISVLSWDGEEAKLDLCETVAPPSFESDFMLNNHLVQLIRRLIVKYSIEGAALESPAYSYSRGMVSIGTIHGCLCQLLIEQKVPFLYVTPNKLKYFAAGPAKVKAWPKGKIIQQVRSVFGSRRWDSNMSDSAVLSVMALCGWHGEFKDQMDVLPTPWDQAWAKHVFYSTAKALGGKPAGIFHRPGEFLWHPLLTIPPTARKTNSETPS